jgi:hypothetical protein
VVLAQASCHVLPQHTTARKAGGTGEKQLLDARGVRMAA